MNQMNLEISNYGPIKEANIELKKLNVIAGINGSGKSTSSKLLSCFIIASSNEGEYLANSSISNQFKLLVSNIHNKISKQDPQDENLNDLLLMLDNLPDYNNDSFNDYIGDNVRELENMIKKFDIHDDVFLANFNNFKELFDFHLDEHHRYFNITNLLLNSEFNFFELKLPENFKVHFHGKNDECEFSHEMIFNENQLGAEITKGYLNCLNLEEVVYIDSPSIFEYNDYQNPIRLERLPYHLRYLSRLLISQKKLDVYDNEVYSPIDEINDLIKNVMGGYIYFDIKKNEFMFRRGDQSYSMKNTASGVKQLGIIQVLLSNRTLKENCFLIIDEPELNLHPDWQVKFAEILVLMIKKLNIHMYINSHSPHFVEALEVYSAKYGLVEDTMFYLSRGNDDKFIFEDILRDDLVILYDNLGDSYDVINHVRAENMKNGIL